MPAIQESTDAPLDGATPLSTALLEYEEAFRAGLPNLRPVLGLGDPRDRADADIPAPPREQLADEVVKESFTTQLARISGELDAWADEAGWPPATRGALACLVHRESRGHPGAHNGNADTGDDSWGLLQVNLYGNLLPGRMAQLRSLGYEVHTRDEAAAVLVQPVPNLRMGLLLSGGGWSFGPWGWACGGG